jgi:hypothetical protein
MMDITRIAIFDWPEMFKPTSDNLQNVIKWFMLRGERNDLVIGMNEGQRARVKKELSPDYDVGKEYLSASIKNPHANIINVDAVYMYLGCKIYIAKNDEHIRENKNTGGESGGA